MKVKVVKFGLLFNLIIDNIYLFMFYLIYIIFGL